MVPQNCHLSSQIKRKGSESIALATKQNKTNRERQTTMERMQTNMTKKHDSSAVHTRITRKLPYLTNRNPPVRWGLISYRRMHFVAKFHIPATSQIFRKLHEILPLPRKLTLQRQPKFQKARILRGFLKIDTSGSQLLLFSTALQSATCTLSYSTVSYSYSHLLVLSATLPSAALTLSSATQTLSYFVAWVTKRSCIRSFPTKLP